MTNKQRKARPTSKQGKEKDHPLELLFQLIVCLTAEGLMEWHRGPGTDLLSHVSVTVGERGKGFLLAGGVKGWELSGAGPRNLYRLAKKAAQQSIAREASELERRATKLRTQIAEKQRRKPCRQ